MCAIFGIIGKTNQKLLRKISRVQIFRGPNSQNIVKSNDKLVQLGSNRLSVIDILNGDQPMVTEDKRFTLVFNGCIYNFLEIKNYLKRKNVNFFSNSDTEVFLKSFQFFGNKAFNYFDGMWASVIYDNKKKLCTLSRDYIGQKPIYYSIQKKYILFSSQVKGIFQDSKISKEINKENLQKYFGYSFCPAPNTIFESVYQIEPGEILEINSETLSIKKKIYWDISKGPDFNKFNKKIKTNKFREEFISNLNNFTIADQKVALALSGGLDSNIIHQSLIAIGNRPKTFTLSFSEKTFDEGHLIKKYFLHNKKNNIIKVTNGDLKKIFLELSKKISEPIGDSSLLPTYILYKKIKENTNVSISGDGGDENFFGYITYDALLIAKFLKTILPNKILRYLKKKIKINDSSKKYMSIKKKINRFMDYIDEEEKYLLPGWLSCLNYKEISEKFNMKVNIENLYKEADKLFLKKKTLVKNAQLYYFKFYLPLILAKIDQASMLNSVENRTPFLSKKIINFCLNINEKKLYSFLKKKKFLKINFKNLIPKSIYNYPKHGFAFPTHVILRDKKIINKFIKKSDDKNNFFYKKYKDYMNNKKDYSEYLWNELILKISLKNINN